MKTPSLKRHQRWLVPAALVLTLAGVFVARTAFARVVLNTIDPVGIVTDQGRRLEIFLVGPPCLASDRNSVRVTVTQRSTGALAEGEAIITCGSTTTSNQYPVLVSTRGKATFAAGPATAVAVALDTTAGQPADAHQWLVEIMLVSE